MLLMYSHLQSACLIWCVFFVNVACPGCCTCSQTVYVLLGLSACSGCMSVYIFMLCCICHHCSVCSVCMLFLALLSSDIQILHAKELNDEVRPTFKMVLDSILLLLYIYYILLQLLSFLNFQEKLDSSFSCFDWQQSSFL